MADELIYSTVRQLAGLLRDRSVSPVELTQLCLERLERLGPLYNSVVTVTGERALALARTAELEISQGRHRGLLHGVPWGAKDLLATSGGIPTTWGAAPFKDQQFDRDATVVSKLENSGAPIGRKVGDDRIGRRNGLHPSERFADRSTEEPLGHWAMARWLFKWVGRIGGRRTRTLCHRIGNMGLYPLAFEQLRPLRHPAHLRPRQPAWGDGPLLDARQTRPDLSHRRRLWDRA